jgi:uncharacterized protein YgbK (DUF1537 family)
MPLIGVLADDLTGAMAAAAVLRQRGISTVVQWDAITAEHAEAVVVNMATRESVGPSIFRRGPSAPERVARERATDLLNLGCRRLELRVDSMLRGHASAELRGIIAAVGDRNRAIYAVPAWPEAGRLTMDHRQVWFNADGTDGEADLKRALFPRKKCKVIDPPVGDGGVATTAREVLGHLEEGVRRFIGVAHNPDHLRLHAKVIATLEAQVDFVTVSSGAWLRYHPAFAHNAEERTFALVALVSSTSTNRLQLARLLEKSPATVVLSAEDALAWALLPASDLLARLDDVDSLVIHDHDDTRDSDTGLSAAEKASEAICALLEASRLVGHSCRGVIASGGFTAWKIAQRLADSHTLEPISIVAPLCALARISGGSWNGLSLITKGGWTGDPDTLITLIDSLRDHHLTAFRDETGDFPTLGT